MVGIVRIESGKVFESVSFGRVVGVGMIEEGYMGKCGGKSKV